MANAKLHKFCQNEGVSTADCYQEFVMLLKCASDSDDNDDPIITDHSDSDEDSDINDSNDTPTPMGMTVMTVTMTMMTSPPQEWLIPPPKIISEEWIQKKKNIQTLRTPIIEPEPRQPVVQRQHQLMLMRPWRHKSKLYTTITSKIGLEIKKWTIKPHRMTHLMMSSILDIVFYQQIGDGTMILERENKPKPGKLIVQTIV